MPVPIQESVCYIAPGCNYKVGIKIYPDAETLQAAAGHQQSFLEGEILALCRCEDGKNGHLVTLHFSQGAGLAYPVIAHEIFHALVELVRVLQLNLNDPHAQELAAHAASWLMQKVQLAAKLSRQRAKQHRRSCGLSHG